MESQDEVLTGAMADADLPTKPKQVGRFQFTGTSGEYFRIWIANLLLSIVTVGIYSAWAKVRTNRYMYGNTLLDGMPFRYDADPLGGVGRLLNRHELVLFGIQPRRNAVGMDDEDVSMQSRVKRFAGAVGLPTESVWGVAISVSEAATNILKYAGLGTISLQVSKDEPRRVIFEALDEGEGVSDLDHAMQDRVSQGVDLSSLQERPIERTGFGLGPGAI